MNYWGVVLLGSWRGCALFVFGRVCGVGPLGPLGLLRLLGLLVLGAGFGVLPAGAGGPKWVAGVSYFNPAVVGQPVVWAGGSVGYFVDQGPLNGVVSNAQAVAMVDAAAGVWSAVPTAAVSLVDRGSLAEDVDGGNVLAGGGVFLQPADVTAGAVATPVGVVFDSDGAVVDALVGSGASLPENCLQNSVLVWVDNFNPSGTIAHGVIVLNGLCATTAGLQSMMSYQLERAFGRILGLDFSQVNDGAQLNPVGEPFGVLGWPVMQPLAGQCSASGGQCIPNPGSLRLDDVAALNRLYPVTAGNVGNFRGKVLTAANTVSIQGTVSFLNGVGMQGVNVVARPLDANGNPLYQYTATAVSGVLFAGNRGNGVTGWVDAGGNRLDRFGGTAAGLQGFFDLSGLPLPPGFSTANYQITFEAVNPLYINQTSVGPYLLGSPAPSGTLPVLKLTGMQAGGAQTVTVTVPNSATGAVERSGDSVRPDLVSGPVTGPIRMRNPIPVGIEAEPQPLPATGIWTSRLGQAGVGDWFVLPVRGNRTFTVVAQALDETGKPSTFKAMPSIGVWDGFAPTSTLTSNFAQAENGFATGETWLQVATAGAEVVRLSIQDQRGDGRPDYTYRGWLLYADTVTPQRLPSTGGTIRISGTGFRTGDTVTVGGVAAPILSLQPNEILAQVPAAGSGVTGSQDLLVSDLPIYTAIALLPGGVSYDSAAGDGLTITAAPGAQVPIGVPQSFSVLAKAADGSVAGGDTVIYSVTSGSASLGCGLAVCRVTATGDGQASMTVTANDTFIAVVTASLTNGASVQAHFSGLAPGSSISLSASTGTLHLAAGATIAWPVQALVESSGAPLAGQQITWQSGTGINAPSGSVASSATGIAGTTLTVGSLAAGQTVASNACLSGGQSCVAFTAFGARTELAALQAVSGTRQSVALTGSPAPIVLRLLDTTGNPMAGGTVMVSQSLSAWAPSCPRHGRCASAKTLLTGSATLTSALDGTVTITPLNLPGVATGLSGIAASGNTATLSFSVVRHP